MSRADLLARLAVLKPWLEEQGVARVGVFGSHARDEATPDSDVDLVVELEPDRTPTLFGFVGLQLALEEKLRAPVDLFTPDSLRPWLKDRIEATLVHV